MKQLVFSLAVLLGSVSVIGAYPAAAVAQDMSNGANNFYESDKVDVTNVTFQNLYHMKVVGHLFTPKGLSPNAKVPAIVVGLPMGAVKEQSADLYATEMAEQGFVTLSIDLTFWGESDGKPGHLVAPDIYSDDFSAAVDFLSTQSFVDKERIGAIGVCGSGSFVLGAAKIDPRLKAIATVSMYDMGAAFRSGLKHSVTLEEGKEFIEKATDQRLAEFAGAERNTFRAPSTSSPGTPTRSSVSSTGATAETAARSQFWWWAPKSFLNPRERIVTYMVVGPGCAEGRSTPKNIHLRIVVGVRLSFAV